MFRIIKESFKRTVDIKPLPQSSRQTCGRHRFAGLFFAKSKKSQNDEKYRHQKQVKQGLVLWTEIAFDH